MAHDQIKYDGGDTPVVENSLVKINVDTNNIILGDLTKASLRRVTAELHVGDTVVAHDVAEEADFTAVVVALVDGKAHLRIDWDSAQQWDSAKDEK